MTKCTHDFHRIADASKGQIVGGTSSSDAGSVFRATPGVEVGCVNCGQIRKVFSDGNVDVVLAGAGPVMDEDAPSCDGEREEVPSQPMG